MILLDTHAWLWWVAARERLSARAREAIAGAGSVGVSPLSCWEVGMLAQRGRIALARPAADWMRQALALPGTRVVEPGPQAAIAAAELPEEFPRDPVDRLLYASAVAAGAPLVTKDRRLRAFDPYRTLW